MDVSIIFVNYKTKDLTIDAIKSVQEKTVGLEYEIFVVDNNSQDGSIEAIEQEFPNINIIKNERNAGFGTANNLGIRQAKGKYVFCLNTDTLLINNAIKIMFDFMEKEENKNVGVCGGYLCDKNMKAMSCGGMLPTINEIYWKFALRYIFRERYKKYKLTINSDDKNYADKIEYIIGADIFFRKSVLDEVGLFDENIFLYYEETDLCKRIKNKGYDIKFVKDAQIIHLEGGSGNNKYIAKERSKTSEFYYFKKYYPEKVLLLKVLYACLYFIDGYILQNSDSKKLLKYVIKL
ncbi:MAG: glycosyltransferase family 2 protein [Candidatus Gastranaerophilales bacterium]|nr:glycosyltransferase family 2 protein [Candidatus Gastranaerophilales bacterium]